MSYRDIIRRYCYELDKKPQAFLTYINENLSPFCYSHQAIYNWMKGVDKPNDNRMKYVMQVYPAGDPRHQFAADVLAAQLEEG